MCCARLYDKTEGERVRGCMASWAVWASVTWSRSHPLGASGHVACGPLGAGRPCKCSFILFYFKNTRIYTVKISGIAGYAGAYPAYRVDPPLTKRLLTLLAKLTVGASC